MTVAKLKGARDRVRRQHGKCEGRNSYAERQGGEEVAAALAAQGYVTPTGRRYSASAVSSMLARS
jgi:hypothetical protein